MAWENYASLVVRLHPPMEKALFEIARKTDRNRSDVIRWLIREKCAELNILIDDGSPAMVLPAGKRRRG